MDLEKVCLNISSYPLDIFLIFVTSFLVVLLALTKNYSYAADLGIIASFGLRSLKYYQVIEEY